MSGLTLQPVEQEPALSVDLGRQMMAILTAKFGAERAAEFARTITAATLPGTPERIAQDSAWDSLTRRLGSAADPTRAAA